MACKHGCRTRDCEYFCIGGACAANAAGHVCQSSASDPINPSHYKSNGMEAIDVIEAFGLSYQLGSAAKYILRAGKKGPAAEDLRKAIWFIEREIKRIGG